MVRVSILCVLFLLMLSGCSKPSESIQDQNEEVVSTTTSQEQNEEIDQLTVSFKGQIELITANGILVDCSTEMNKGKRVQLILSDTLVKLIIQMIQNFWMKTTMIYQSKTSLKGQLLKLFLLNQ